jgi:thermitase
MPLERGGVAVTNLGRLLVRIRYEHAFCLLGRKQGPIVHSLTLLPKEELRIYEYDRYHRSTTTTNRFSARSSFFTLTQRVQDALSNTKVASGAQVSTFSTAVGDGGAELDLGIISFGGGASSSGGVSTNTHFDVVSVSERFSHVAETSSLAVETERSVVISTFQENESMRSTARLLRNDNECRAVTYYVRRVFEVYQLTTKIVGIDVQIGDQWIDLGAAPQAIQDDVRKFLQKVDVGAKHDPKVEIALPTDGLLYEAELAHCCSCECEHQARSRLQLEKLQLENLNLRLEAGRRQRRLDAGELEAFDAPFTVE